MQLDARLAPNGTATGQHFFSSVGHSLATSITHVRDRFATQRAARSADASENVLVINGHPDPRPERFCAALCDAYVEGSRRANRSVRRLDAGSLTMVLAAAQAVQDDRAGASQLEPALDMIRWAGHLTIIFPLWLDQAPVPLQRLLSAASHRPADSLASRVRAARSRQTARTIVTMEMPAFAHRAMFRGNDGSPALSLPELEMAEPTFIGCVNTIADCQRKRWLQKMHDLGMAGR